MKKHDPFSYILNELRKFYNCDTDEQFEQCLINIKPFVTSIREEYKKSPCAVDYSNHNNRLAYMLCYYPYYIDIIYNILYIVINDRLQQMFFEGNRLQVCFLGAGPGPEILGLLAYLDDYYSNITKTTAYVLDKYIKDWKYCQNFTRNLSRQYWKGNLDIHSLNFDFLRPDTSIYNSAAYQSNIYIIQNCLNDNIGEKYILMSALLEHFKHIPNQSLFIIVDLKFDKVYNFITQYKRIISNEVRFISNIDPNCYKIHPNINYPEILKKLFNGQNGLFFKNSVNCYYSVMLKL